MEKIFAYKDQKKPYLVISEKLKNFDEKLFVDIVKGRAHQLLQFDEHLLDETSKLHKKYSKLLAEGEVGWIYSKKRRFDTETIFSLKDAVIFVEKKFVEPGSDLRRYKNVVFHSIAKAPIFQGIHLKERLHDLIKQNDFIEFEKEFTVFLNEFFKKFTKPNGAIESAAIEALPRNCIVDQKGAYNFFDLEYSLSHDISREFCIFRICLVDFGEFKEILDKNFGGNFLKYFTEKMGGIYNSGELVKNQDMEYEFQKGVCFKKGILGKIGVFNGLKKLWSLGCNKKVVIN